METVGTIARIPLERIHADDEFNCRGKIRPLDVSDLAKDIEKHGLIQPVTVAPCDEEQKKQTGRDYWLVAGFRRHMAHIVAKLSTIDCIIREDLTDPHKARVCNISENLKRKDLTLLQEANAIKRLYEFGLTEEMVAAEIDMSRGWVQSRFMLLKLPEELQREVDQGKLTISDIRELYSLMRHAGIEAAFQQAKNIKESRELGRKHTKKTPDSKEVKKVRTRKEVIHLLDSWFECGLDANIGTRMLAWAVGEIDTKELESDLKSYASKANRLFTWSSR